MFHEAELQDVIARTARKHGDAANAGDEVGVGAVGASRDNAHSRVVDKIG